MSRHIHLIGNAHLDPVWLWKRREGLAEIKATFQSALDRMQQFGSYIFTSACASYYQWVEENEPEMFEKIQRQVKEGRWAVAGGMWVQPDCNLPSGEALVRHLLYSQRYFAQKFGRPVNVGYNVDSFGHNAMLPQLLSKAGIDSYVFMRPDSGEKDLPCLFLWESPDGSHVTAFRIPFGYSEDCGAGDPSHGISHDIGKLRNTQALAEKLGLPMMNFYGVGNHGGGPTVRCLRELEKAVAEDNDVFYSSPERYFQETAPLKESLPVVKEGLQHHASGCYSACSLLKKANRVTENRLVSAEKYDVLASLFTQKPSGRARIFHAYDKLMFNQFHDILAGCSIKEALMEAERYFHAAWAEGEDVAEAALQRISWHVDTEGDSGPSSGKIDGALWESDGEGAPVVVFNPHSFAVEQTVQINSGWVRGILDDEGSPVPFQKVRGPQANGPDYFNTIFRASLPAMGYRTYYLYIQKTIEARSAKTVSAAGNVLENEWTRVELNKRTGAIRLVFDKTIKRVVMGQGGARALVIDDEASDTWAHGIFEFSKEEGEFGNARLEVTENGPVRATVRATGTFRHSTLVQEFTLYGDRPEVYVRCRLDFHEPRKIVKLVFPLRAHCEQAFYEIPFGFEKKPCDGLEEPGHRFAGITGFGSDGVELMLAVLNDCKYSFSAKNDELRMIVARSCGFAEHFSDRSQPVELMDQGLQEFRYVICFAEEKDLSSVTRQALLFNQNIEHIMETRHKGKLPGHCSAMEIDCDNIVCDTVKFAEDSDALVLRLYETAGRAAHATVTLRFPGFEARLPMSFTKHEIKTVMVKKGGRAIETDLLERPVPGE